MSDTYKVDGVTVTPSAGGWYELSHASLDEPEKVQGKETADNRAKEIAAAAAVPESTIEAQGDLPDAPVELAPEPDAKKSKADPIADLTALVMKQQEQIAKLLDRPAATVETEGEYDPQDPLRTVPRSFTGQVDAKTRKAMAKIGVEYVTIILEENSDIPPTGLFISHNHKPYMIAPGEPVDVPDFLLHVLEDAVMSAPVVDSKSQKVLGYRNRMKYPFRKV